jgi:hypothetical protein
MFNWMKRPIKATSRLDLTSSVDPHEDTGEYRLLYKYLRDRYADSVVLTFAQIEDLLGFSLPDAARRHEAWWGTAGPDTDPSKQSASWTRASRAAAVNMAAQIVVFDRLNAPAS